VGSEMTSNECLRGSGPGVARGGPGLWRREPAQGDKWGLVWATGLEVGLLIRLESVRVSGSGVVRCGGGR